MKSLERPGVKFLGNYAHGGGHFADLHLGVVVFPQLQEVD
jgi:hypothetical protein